MARAKVDRCDICEHAISVHNDLGYCRVNNARFGRWKGMCPCDGTTTAAREIAQLMEPVRSVSVVATSRPIARALRRGPRLTITKGQANHIRKLSQRTPDPCVYCGHPLADHRRGRNAPRNVYACKCSCAIEFRPAGPSDEPTSDDPAGQPHRA